MYSFASLEDSTRNVSGSWCDRDPSLVVGCTQVAPENQKFEIANPMSTFVENVVAQGVLDLLRNNMLVHRNNSGKLISEEPYVYIDEYHQV